MLRLTVGYIAHMTAGLTGPPNVATLIPQLAVPKLLIRSRHHTAHWLLVVMRGYVTNRHRAGAGLMAAGMEAERLTAGGGLITDSSVGGSGAGVECD